MEISSIQICKIDLEKEEIEAIDSSTYGYELVGYLSELFSVVISGSSGRCFQFERDTTEVRAQISRINNNEDFVDIAKVIANRLFACEFEAQEKINRLGKEILKGLVVQAKIENNGQDMFVICKADHSEFLDEVEFKLSKGLPVKKKAFKAFVCNLNLENTADGILVYDTNTSDTKYWWKEFLELKMLYTDEDNTENAFNSIDKGVFTKIKKDHPQDYTYLRNSVVHYFRSSARFVMAEFLDTAIGDYEPIDPALNMGDLKNKIRELPQKKRTPFDNQFNIIKEKVTARFRNTVKLTNQIDLHIKEDVPENIIIAELGADGEKYVKIRSEEGFKFFRQLNEGNAV